MNRLAHIRRPDPMLRQGMWRIRCDCGWEAQISPLSGNTPRPGAEIAEELEKAFVGHLAAPERRMYLLVDQRPDHVGNWIMPEGVPCLLIKHWEMDGVRWARFQTVEFIGDEARPGREGGQLPVGEVRTADGRVFRADLSAMTNEPVPDRSTG